VVEPLQKLRTALTWRRASRQIAMQAPPLLAPDSHPAVRTLGLALERLHPHVHAVPFDAHLADLMSGPFPLGRQLFSSELALRRGGAEPDRRRRCWDSAAAGIRQAGQEAIHPEDQDECRGDQECSEHIERGIRRPSAPLLARLAAALGCSADDLLAGVAGTAQESVYILRTVSCMKTLPPAVQEQVADYCDFLRRRARRRSRRA